MAASEGGLRTDAVKLKARAASMDVRRRRETDPFLTARRTQSGRRTSRRWFGYVQWISIRRDHDALHRVFGWARYDFATIGNRK